MEHHHATVNGTHVVGGVSPYVVVGVEFQPRHRAGEAAQAGTVGGVAVGDGRVG